MKNQEIIDLKQYIVDNGLEKMNKSFNKYGINNIKETFPANKTAERFLIICKRYNFELNYENFYNYLNKYILQNKGGFNGFLNERVEKWKKKEKQFSKKDMETYIIVKFVYDTLQGKVREINVENELIKNNIHFTHPTEIEDVEKGWDYILNDKKVIQVKPISWFYGNDFKQQHIVNSIHNSLNEENVCIFLAIYDEKLKKCLVLTPSGFKDLKIINILNKNDLIDILENKKYKRIKK